MVELSDFRSGIASLLLRRQLPGGGWSHAPNCRQENFEATALAVMALRGSDGGNRAARDRAVGYLLATQNSNGSWPAFTGDDDQGSWTTALALIALENSSEALEARLEGARWLLSTSGREAHWLWQWKFRLFDRQARSDPLKYGWPWHPQTNSWVVPTSFAILALQGLPQACGLDGYSERIALAHAMLLDRACPGGGWNSGNSVVYGSALAAHADDTAIALLALKRQQSNPVVSAGLDWLEQTASTLPACASLALSVLTLSLFRRQIAHLSGRLIASIRFCLSSTATLALTGLAIAAMSQNQCSPMKRYDRQSA
jgi:hypothetical protein